MMSSLRVRPGRARISAKFVLVPVFLSLLSGCYTRQIEGIQSDLDSLDRKLHSLNLKKEQSRAAGVSKKTILRLEDQLNQVTLQQADLRDAVASLQEDLAEIRRESLAAGAEGGPGGESASVSNSQLRQLAADIAQNEEKTEQLSKQVNKLQETFDGLRRETRSLISLLKEELGAEEIASEPELPSMPVESVSTTEVEGPASGLSAPAESKSVSVEREYRVSPGENLTTIAKKFGVKLDDLRRINNIENPDDLKMGQVIYIP